MSERPHQRLQRLAAACGIEEVALTRRRKAFYSLTGVYLEEIAADDPLRGPALRDGNRSGRDVVERTKMSANSPALDAELFQLMLRQEPGKAPGDGLRIGGRLMQVAASQSAFGRR